MKRYYPHLLVTLQFGTIFAMILYAATDFSFSLPGLLLLLAGVATGLWAIAHHPKDNFNIRPELKEACCLVTHGLYRYIRHPMYTSVMLMQMGIVLFRPTSEAWAMWAFLVLVLYLKAHREEKLWMVYDAAYAAYRKRTRYFIPYIL